MKTTIFSSTLVLLLFIVGSALCQDTLSTSNGDKSYAIVSRLGRELNLNNSQQKKIYRSLDKRWSAISTSRKNKQSLNFKTLNEQVLEDLKVILSPSQYNSYLKLREQKVKERQKYPSESIRDEDKELDI